ncbi:hypothetical protein [Phyllobacterium sp. SB3]|uniref:hypothetical protein n=1 Tax=Phyllobacterium sp. SB3 TaxID=3156073 RepID=UPI0032AF9609
MIFLSLRLSHACVILSAIVLSGCETTTQTQSAKDLQRQKWAESVIKGTLQTCKFVPILGDIAVFFEIPLATKAKFVADKICAAVEIRQKQLAEKQLEQAKKLLKTSKTSLFTTTLKIDGLDLVDAGETQLVKKPVTAGTKLSITVDGKTINGITTP